MIGIKPTSLDVHLTIMLNCIDIMHTIKHETGIIEISETTDDNQHISITPASADTFIRTAVCDTHYPISLIEAIVRAKGASHVCDEIRRDQDPFYIEHHIVTTLFTFVDKNDFKGKRLLDFGCGAGASTMIFARNLPDTEIVGIELEKENLDIARGRAEFYQYKNIQFFQSPSAETLPKDLGTFDYIFLPAVYEHLLPEERDRLIGQLWNLLKKDGVLFIDETPHRWFPIETHTTGLPLINYLPEALALRYAQYCSNHNLQKDSWQTLLRKGIRGSTLKEITQTIQKNNGSFEVLKSINPSLKNPVDIWFEGYAKNEPGKTGKAKRIMKLFLSIFYSITRIPLVPYISLAIKKRESGVRDTGERD